MRWHKDEVDLWCEQWASQRRKILGITELQPKERIGKLNSTLGSIKTDRDGASQGTVTQAFPEVYIGADPNYPLLVNRAWREMKPQWREVIEAHYVYKGSIKQKAFLIEVTVANYWKHWTFAKNYIHGFVTVSTKYSDEKTEVIVYTQKTLVNA